MIIILGYMKYVSEFHMRWEVLEICLFKLFIPQSTLQEGSIMDKEMAYA